MLYTSPQPDTIQSNLILLSETQLTSQEQFFIHLCMSQYYMHSIDEIKIKLICFSLLLEAIFISGEKNINLALHQLGSLSHQVTTLLKSVTQVQVQVQPQYITYYFRSS